LGLALNQKDSGLITAKILKDLKRRIGIEIYEYPEMDREYFENTENIKKDLEKFAEIYRVTIQDLSVPRNNFSVRCCNGEEVKWQSYLMRAAVSIGLLSTQSDKSIKKSEIIKELKRRIGIEVK
jgi:hypothetical protein